MPRVEEEGWAEEVKLNTKHIEWLPAASEHMPMCRERRQKVPLSPEQGLYSDAFIRDLRPTLLPPLSHSPSLMIIRFWECVYDSVLQSSHELKSEHSDYLAYNPRLVLESVTQWFPGNTLPVGVRH